jgi:hypothetical protein
MLRSDARGPLQWTSACSPAAACWCPSCGPHHHCGPVGCRRHRPRGHRLGNTDSCATRIYTAGKMVGSARDFVDPAAAGSRRCCSAWPLMLLLLLLLLLVLLP